jgi:SHS2 domain-containing protein
MRSHTPISHTSEAGLHLEASSLEELFLAGLEGIAQHLVPDILGNWSPGVSVPVTLASVDQTALLIDFLSEALTLGHIQRAVFYSAPDLKVDGNSLTATLIGEPVERFDDDIKAITYHGAEIRRNQDGSFETIVIFDI